MPALPELPGWFQRTFRRLVPIAPGPRWPKLSPVARFVERSVHMLDSAIPIPGTRIRVGLDPLLGLVFPAGGDALGGVISLGMLFLAVQYRVPANVIGRMVMNVAIDAAIGGIPIVGDIFDFGFKSNEANFNLLMQHRGDMPKRTSLRYWFTVTTLLLAGLAVVVAPIALVVWFIWYRTQQ